MAEELLTDDQGKKLLDIARETVEYFSEHGEKPEYEKEGFLFEERGVFTILRKDNELRGCIGFPKPIETLLQAVQDSAVKAAFEDPRFEPVKEDELESITFEVSVLTVPERIEFEDSDELVGKVEVGKHGLIVSSGFKTGLLLPQVAEENSWSSEEFLSQTCRKAGLSEDAWRERELIVKRFRAQVFSDD